MAEVLDVAELSRRCQAETERYLRGDTSTDRHCFELFRRAVVERDEAAWVAVYAQYAAVVRRWLSARMDADEGVAAAFERFWRALDAAKFARFGSLGAILAYLKMCVHSAALDQARAQRSTNGQVALEAAWAVPAGDDVEGSVGDRLDDAAFWAEVERGLDDERERLVLYLSYVIDLSPRQIHARYPDRFPQMADIYRLKRSALDRLRRVQPLRPSPSAAPVSRS